MFAHPMIPKDVVSQGFGNQIEIKAKNKVKLTSSYSCCCFLLLLLFFQGGIIPENDFAVCHMHKVL